MAEQTLNERKTLAQLITQDIVSLHDSQARKHECPGYDCAICSLHGLESRIEEIIGNSCPVTKRPA